MKETFVTWASFVELLQVDSASYGRFNNGALMPVRKRGSRILG